MNSDYDLEPDADSGWIADIRSRLRDWYESGHRMLPWRRDRDPYHILVSELMLVQTTAPVVAVYYERFLARFPSVQTLADADEAAVIKLWEGLGYYRRARQLHAAARMIVREHAGSVPRTRKALLALPGVGRYIAGAVLSFAFDQPEPILEANSQRVLARLLAWPGEVRSAESQSRLWKAAQRLVPDVGAGVFNQALIELGATVCGPREPQCLLCPVSTRCGSRARGIQGAIPRLNPPPQRLVVVESCGLVVRRGRLLLVRRGRGQLWERMWEFPTIHVSGPDPANRSLGETLGKEETLARITGYAVELGPAVKSVSYSVTRYRVGLTAHAARVRDGVKTARRRSREMTWVRLEELDRYTFGTPGRRLRSWLNDAGGLSALTF